jgi:hypothetical protein
VKLKGLIEEVFTGITIFRGYATLKTLAELSKLGNYQRSHEKERISAIKEYMSSSPFIFFPELIFGWQIKDDSVIKQIKEEETIKSIDDIKFKKNKFRFKPFSEIEGPITKMLTIEIPDSLKTPILDRIDGNHRLGVIDNMLAAGEESTLLNMVVPYSIIMQSSNSESQKYEVAYFYLINSKAKPLTTDQNLKSIINANLFSGIEKQNLLSLSSVQIKYLEKIAKFFNEQEIDFAIGIFNKQIFELTVTLITYLIDKDATYSEDIYQNIIKAIKIINSLYIKEEIMYPQEDVILALIINKYLNPKAMDRFLSWINKNEMGSIDHLRFDNIIRVFDTIHKQRSYKVFVAMPYISHARVEEFNNLFREVFNEISNKIGFGLELIPIMRFKGASQRIDARLIQKIKECDIFIGDLTTCNDNVIFEVGLAEGFGKKILLIRSEEDTDKMPFDEASKLDKGKFIPFDMDKLQYIPYSNSGYYNKIKGIMRNNMPAIVEQLRNRSI